MGRLRGSVTDAHPHSTTPWLVLGAAVWHGRRTVEPGPALDAALRLARRNQVQGLLARVYPDALGAELERVVQGNADFRHRLAEAVERLSAGGVDPILIKCDPAADFVYGNFDLVVGDDGWASALQALDGWAMRYSGHRLEPDKLIVHPPGGPAAHLHRNASWFGIVAVEAAALRRQARRDASTAVLRPDPVDELRLLVAHSVFQNLAFDLSELVAVREVLRQGADVDDARRRSAREGWGSGFTAAFAQACRAIERLDRDQPVHLPVGLPPLASLRDGLLHSAHLARTGRSAMAVRELALRGPLVAAKLRRRAADRRVHLLGVSGPDGSGKTTLVKALRGEAEEEDTRVVSLHPYGCVICRRWPAVAPRGGASSAKPTSPLWRMALQAHAIVDTTELNLRIAAARTWLRLQSAVHHGQPGLVITDRSPLDALAKHSAAGSRVARRLRGLARRYDRILLLDAEGDVLAARDGDHSRSELSRQRRRFRDLAAEVEATTVDSSEPFSAEMVGRVVRDVTTPQG